MTTTRTTGNRAKAASWPSGSLTGYLHDHMLLRGSGDRTTGLTGSESNLIANPASAVGNSGFSTVAGGGSISNGDGYIAGGGSVTLPAIDHGVEAFSPVPVAPIGSKSKTWVGAVRDNFSRSTAGTMSASTSINAAPTSVTWTGSAGNGDWDTAGNWSDNAVPTSSSDVGITLTSATVTHRLATTNEVNTLLLGGTDAIDFTAGALEVGGSITTGARLSSITPEQH